MQSIQSPVLVLTILLGLLVTLTLPANAQENSMLFLALNNGDTIRGEYSEPKIRFSNSSNDNLTLAQKFVLTNKITKEENEYELKAIAAVHMFSEVGEEIYRPKELDIFGYRGIDLFLAKQLIQGPISLYEIRVPRKYGRNGFSIGGIGFSFRSEDNRTMILERGDYCTIVKPNRFRKDFADYFFGYPKLVESIKSKDLGFDELGNIVRQYNEFKSGKPDLVGYSNGFVNLLNGARISGKIKVYNPAKSCRKFKFVDDMDRPVKISDKLVHSYQRGNEYYRKHELVNGSDTSIVYLLQVVSGPVSLFRFTSDLEIKYHKKLPTIEYGEVFRFFFERNGEIWAIEQKNFHDQTSQYFSETPELSRRIANRELGYNDLIPILQIYSKEISQ